MPRNNDFLFSDFVETNGPYVKKVRALLSIKLDSNAVAMSEQLRELQAHYARMDEILGYAKGYLATAEYEHLPEQGTELKRKTAQQAAVVPHRRFRDACDGICRAVKSTVSLGQSLLKSQENTYHQT